MPICPVDGKEFVDNSPNKTKKYCCYKCYRQAATRKHNNQPINNEEFNNVRKNKKRGKMMLVPLLDKELYVWVADNGYPMCRYKGKTQGVHRVIKILELGRDLFPDETVHHIYGDKMDFRPQNLELWSKHHPSGQRVEDKIKSYSEFLERYGLCVSKQFNLFARRA